MVKAAGRKPTGGEGGGVASGPIRQISATATATFSAGGRGAAPGGFPTHNKDTSA